MTPSTISLQNAKGHERTRPKPFQGNKSALVDSQVQTEYADELDAATMKFRIKEEALNSAIDQACRKAAGLQREKEQLQREIRQKTKEMMALRDQVAIYK